MSLKGSHQLTELLRRNLMGSREGVFSVCTANQAVLETCIDFAVENDTIILIESTSNQVNQEGGYTGLTPMQFAANIRQLLQKRKLNPERVILGGDHLGPYPWRYEKSDSAVQKACKMTADYVSAGYSKIHLDASMRCVDDPIDFEENKHRFAERAASLCKAAEEAYNNLDRRGSPPVYVIGTEVPRPGGAVEDDDTLQPTSIKSLEETISMTKQAFLSQGLDAAWERAAAVVVQPGVEFGDQTIHHYNRERSKHLVENIINMRGLVYEAHSTDYQTGAALKELVEDHFAILKVGPELTYAYRRGLFALGLIEKDLAMALNKFDESNLHEMVDIAMLANPKYWKGYYAGDERDAAFSRKYSFSDRIRYYWPQPIVVESIRRLFLNLSSTKIPLPLIHQYMPEQYNQISEGLMENSPTALINDIVNSVLKKYHSAVIPKK